MHLLPLILCFVLFSASPSYSNRTGYVVHEKRSTHSHSDWYATRRLHAATSLPLRIALKQRNLDLLPDFLLAVSDPQSTSYGQHWTSERVISTFAPKDDAVHAVREWLETSGVDVGSIHNSANKVWLELRDSTAGQVEKLLNTSYHVFRRAEGEEEHIACDSYTLPDDISTLVDFITPTVQMHPTAPVSRVRRASHSKPENHYVKRTDGPLVCDKAVTPGCLRSLYNMTYTPQAADRNSLGIVNYYSNIYLQSDLDTFFRNFSPALVGKSPELVSIDGGSLKQDTSTSGGEAGWILQYAMTLVQPQSVQLLQIGNSQIPEFRSFNEWLDAVDESYCTLQGGDDLTYDPTLPNPLPGGFKGHSCGTVTVPYVVSNSQADQESRFSQFYLERQCAEFGKLGLMGVTVLYSAGNTGVSGSQSGYCLDKNGSMNPNATHFNPSWPASCPWVTAVGGTQVIPGAEAVPGAEEVWNQEIIPGFFESGGGGFSNRFPVPKYQKRAVEVYLAALRKNDPKKLELFNNAGRAYPDLSANANSFVNVDNGSFTLSSGTSGSVPSVAAIITLVNDARLAAGKKPVGFINPTIYSPAFSSAFNDITNGTSQGCRGLQGEQGGGFKADKGWDPASGLGSPNLGKLIEQWLLLP